MTGAQIKKLRLLVGMSQAELALRGKVHSSRLCSAEAGYVRLSTNQVRRLSRALADAFGERIDRLVKGHALLKELARD